MLDMLCDRIERSSVPLEGGDEESAILVPITDDSAAPQLILTCRGRHLRRHAGEVAFPGGVREYKRDESPLQAALRESHEEISLPGDRVRILGRLPHMQTRFDMRVAPFVGLIPAAQPLIADRCETEQIFRVPVDFFCADNLLADEYSHKGQLRRLPRFCYQGHDIWGFTAQVIVVFCRIGAGITLDAQAVADSRVRQLYPDGRRS